MRVRKTYGILGLLMIFAVFSALAYAQTSQKGEITGIVIDDQGTPLPGVTATVTGERLFQKSLSLVSNGQGVFRFLNLNPGIYSIEVSLSGFKTVQITSVQVSVGKATQVEAKMIPSTLTSEVTVVASAPLIQAKSPQITTNFNRIQVENAPTSRHFIDIVNAAPGVYDNTAYGASGNVSWGGGGIYLARGSMTSSFRLNGVDVSDPSVGYTTLNPIYESIDEVQVTGIGASAEYGSFVGAAINVITKSGTNKLHGSLTAVYSDSKTFYANYNKTNSVQYYNYSYYWKHDYEGTFTLSGPLIKEKLFFSVAGGRESKWPRYGTSTIYQTFEVWRAYAKVDYLLNAKNTFSLIYNMSSADQGNQGLYAGYYDPSVAFHSKSPNNTLFASLNTIVNETTFIYAKLAGFKSHIKWDPVTKDVPQYTNYAPMGVFGGSSMERNVYSSNLEVNVAMTHFADNFLGTSHEFKAGLEYQDGRAGETRHIEGGGSFYRYPYGDGNVLWGASTGGDQDFLGVIKSFRTFIQDNFKVAKNFYANLGLRYETPRFNARNFSGSGNIASFKALSPRVGLTYDLAGNQKNVIRASFGIYYNKPITQTYYSSFPGNADSYRYNVTLPDAPFDPTPENLIDQLALIAQTENLTSVQTFSQPVPVDPNIKLNNNYTYNLGFSHQFGSQFALDIDYIYRRDHNHYQMSSSTVHTYLEYEWTDIWFGNSIPLWRQIDSLPDVWTFTNSTFAKKNDHLLMIVFRKMPSRNWSLIASYTYQNSKQNLASTGSNDLFGAPPYNMDTDPAYFENPLMWGRGWCRPHQGKVMTTYFGPWGINMTADLQIMSGMPWAAMASSSFIPVDLRPSRPTGYPELLLEPRGSRDLPVSWNLNFRFAKAFKIGVSKLELRLDVLNALNAEYYYRVSTSPAALYSDGTSAFGKPTSLFPPRNSKISVAWSF